MQPGKPVVLGRVRDDALPRPARQPRFDPHGVRAIRAPGDPQDARLSVLAPSDASRRGSPSDREATRAGSTSCGSRLMPDDDGWMGAHRGPRARTSSRA